MNKLLRKLATGLLGFAMAAGVGVAIGTADKLTEKVDAAIANTNWVEITDKTKLADGGQFIITTNDSSCYLNESVGSGHFSATAITSSTPGTDVNGIFELVKVSSGVYKIHSLKSDKYVTATKKGSGGGAMSDTDTYGWSFSSYSSGFDAVYQNSKAGANLRSYSNSSFRTYSGTSYGAKFRVYRYNASLSSIALSGSYQTTFTVGDAFNHDGMVVTASYSNSTTKDVSNNATWSTPDMSTAGEKEITVSYTEGGITKTAKYDITVETPSTPYISVNSTVSGNIGSNTSLAFTYGNLNGVLTVTSSIEDNVTVQNLSYSNGSGTIQVNFIKVGSSTLTFFDGSTSLATCTATTNPLQYVVEFGTTDCSSGNTFEYSIPSELSFTFSNDYKVYGVSTTPTNLKVGASGTIGTLPVSLSSSAPANTYISGVSVWAKRYNDKGVKLSVTPTSGSAVTTSSNIAASTTKYDFDVSSTQATSVTIASVANGDARLYIEKISIQYAYKACLDSISTEGQTTVFTHNSAFDYDGTLTASYTQGKADVEGVTPTAFKIGASGISPDTQGTTIEEGDLLTVSDNEKYIYVGYTDTGLTKWVSYQIFVTYENLTDNDLTMTSGPINAPLSQGSVQLSASVTNTHANPSISWSSSNNDIATVDQTGLVTFVTSGEVTITASGANSVSKTCVVNISNTITLTLDVTSISDKYTGDDDVIITPTYTNIPQGSTFTWSSSNDNVATVSEGTNHTGIVHFTGTSTQQETITLTITNNNETVKSASCTLDDIVKSEVTRIDIEQSTYTLYDNQYAHTVQLTATIDDEDVIGNANKNVTWESSDDSLATVSSTGLVTAQDGVGGTAQDPVTVTITAKSAYTSTTQDTCEITITHDTVSAIEWTGNTTPSSFYTGDVLGDVSNWKFNVTWTSGKKENNKDWGDGSNDIHLNICGTSVDPTTETDNPLTQDYEMQLSDNSKRLVPFYKGYAAQAKVLTVNQSAVTAITISHERISEGSLSMYDTETLTLEYGVTSVGNVNKGIDWEVSNNAVSFTDQGYDGNGVGHIQVSGSVCKNVTLTGTSKNDSGVSESITISIEADTVQSLTWSGTSDVLEYESGTKTLGSVIDSSGWSFTANWIKKTESNLVVGSGANNVQIGVFDTATPSVYSSENAYDSTDTLDISYNNKYLVAFYKGVPSTETIRLKIVKILKDVTTPSSTKGTYTWEQSDVATSDFPSSAGSATLNGVTWSVLNRSYLHTATSGPSGARYTQIGKGSNAENMTLKTSEIEGKITKISVDCASGSAGHTIAISVGGVSYLDATATPNWSNNSGDVVSATGTSSGEISIVFNKGSSTKAMYIRSIEVEWEKNVDTPITNKEDYKEAQYAVVEFAQYMNSQMNGENVCTGDMSNLATAWGNVRDKYNALFVSGDNKLTGTQLERAIAIMQKANANWNEDHDSDEQYCLERALKTYEWCTSHYNATICPRFMDGVRSAGHNPGISPLINIINGQNTNTVAIIVIISMVSVTAIGGYFFLRKRKENN